MNAARDSLPVQAILLLDAARGVLVNAEKAETLDEARNLIGQALVQIQTLAAIANEAAGEEWNP
jgi:hypothetical protein